MKKVYIGENENVVVVARFKNSLEALGYKENTRLMLLGCVRDFLGYTEKPLLLIKQNDIRGFRGWLEERPNRRRGGGLSAMFIHHHMYALRVFFKELECSGVLLENPMSVLKFPAPQCAGRRPLSREEIEGLFACAETLQERTALHLLYSCGLRRSEAEGLNLGDVQVKKQRLYVRSGKGARRRVVPLTARVAEELESYCEQERLSMNVQEAKAFMLNSQGKRMRGDHYCRLVRKLVRRSGVSESTSPHHLRHSIATHLLESGLPLEQVRDFLGHRRLETTQVYTKVSPGSLKRLW